MLRTNSERLITRINQNVFYNEFTFDKTDFIAKDNNLVELADNILWLDSLLIIIQIKERIGGKDNTLDGLNKWFDNKVLNRAKEQIKNTNSWLKESDGIDIRNGYNQVSTLRHSNLKQIHNIIIYHLNDAVPDGFSPEVKYVTKHGLFIHIISSEDYSNLCRYLMTPTEIGDYLSFRADLLRFYPKGRFPEQYILSHYFQNPNDLLFNAEYISELPQICALIRDNESKFSLSSFISKFKDSILWEESNSHYLPVVKELAKLNRVEMMKYKESLTNIVMNEPEDPFIFERFLFERTNCGFIICRIRKDLEHNWRNVLTNLTESYKYSLKCEKCLGVISIGRSPFNDLIWMFIDYPWEYNDELEDMSQQFSRQLNTKRVQEVPLVSALKNNRSF